MMSCRYKLGPQRTGASMPPGGSRFHPYDSKQCSPGDTVYRFYLQPREGYDRLCLGRVVPGDRADIARRRDP